MKIIENDKKYLHDFIFLNEEWIKRYFELEYFDIDLAKNPYQIIENGGYIFTVLKDNEVVAVCALINHNNDTYELARMAVKDQYQGRGYSSILIETCLEKLNNINAKKVFLVSNTKLEIAISLYKKYKFRSIKQEQHPIYKRANIEMELKIL
jgi:N-acetylglutamate synthase-like GNAT family acetyltransferase